MQTITRDVCNTKTTTVDTNTEILYKKGDYVKVCKMVDEQIISKKKCVFTSSIWHHSMAKTIQIETKKSSILQVW